MPKYMATEAPFAAENARLRKKRSGSIGAFERISIQTKTPMITMPPMSEAEHLGRAPAERVRAHHAPDDAERGRRPRATTPAMSSLSAGPFVSRRWIQASGIVTRPIGTFSQKIHCQAMPVESAPPTIGPIATARPAIPPHAPRIAPRFSGGVSSARIVSVSGVTIAAPRPWMARAMISISVPVESAAITDATVKIDRPMTNRSLRPKRSPSAAPVSSSTAKVSV